MTTILETLRPFGITRCYKGFPLTVYAIHLAVMEEDRLEEITEKIYRETADHFGCKWTAVERNLRTVVSRAWQVNPDLLCQMCIRDSTHCDVGGCLLRHVLLNKIFHEIHCLFPPVIQVFMGKFPMHALGACPRGPPFFHRRRIFYQVAEQIASINCKVFPPAPEIPLTFPRISCSFFLFASGGQGRLPGSTSLAPVRET